MRHLRWVPGVFIKMQHAIVVLGVNIPWLINLESILKRGLKESTVDCPHQHTDYGHCTPNVWMEAHLPETLGITEFAKVHSNFIFRYVLWVHWGGPDIGAVPHCDHRHWSIVPWPHHWHQGTIVQPPGETLPRCQDLRWGLILSITNHQLSARHFRPRVCTVSRVLTILVTTSLGHSVVTSTTSSDHRRRR